MWHISLLIFCFSLAGCLSIASERLLIVNGVVSNEALVEGCLIKLYRDGASSPNEFDVSEINNTEFSIDYLVSPSAGLYRITLSCSGSVVNEKSVRISSAKTVVDM